MRRSGRRARGDGLAARHRSSGLRRTVPGSDSGVPPAQGRWRIPGYHGGSSQGCRHVPPIAHRHQGAADRQRRAVRPAAAVPAGNADVRAVHAVAAQRRRLRPVLARTELPALAVADLRLSAWRFHPPAVQHAGPVHVRRATGADLGREALRHLLPGVRGRRRPVPAAGSGADRRGRQGAGRVRRRVRPAAGVRHAVPEPAGDAAVPADPDEGAHLRHRVRRHRADAGVHRLAAGRGAFRAPGRHAVRLAADPLLARAAAVQPPRRWRASQPPAPGDGTRRRPRQEGTRVR